MEYSRQHHIKRLWLSSSEQGKHLYARKGFIKKENEMELFYDDKVSIFTKIAEKYDWKIIGKPMLLSGGFMHKMYRIDTQQGTFALKLLNPFVMQRETAMDNFAKAERIELLLEQQGVPILPALSFDGRKMQEVDGEHFYLFDYFPGKALQGNEITAYHCKEMGKVLAEIHSIDKKYENEVFCEMSIDWNFYLAEMKNTDTKLYAMLKDALPVIQDSQNKGNQARKNSPQSYQSAIMIWTAKMFSGTGMIIALLIWNAYLIATRLWNCLNWHCAGQDMKIAK